MSKLDFYRLMIMKPDEGDQSGGGGNQGDDGKKADEGNQGGDKKSMISMDDLKGKEGQKADDEGKKADDQKTDDKSKKAERPEHIPEKFWDPEKGEIKHEAMMKSYNELEKKQSGNKKAPDDYKIELDDDLKKIFHEGDADKDPMLAWYKGFAKENGFTQEMFNKGLKEYGQNAAKFLSENSPAAIDPKVEMEKLGKNSEAIVKNQIDFLGGMFKRGEINEAQAQEILILTETAAGIEALQAIRKHYGEQQSIPLNLGTAGGIKSADELRSMQANPKYGTDPEYTATVDKEYEKKYGTGRSGQSLQSPL